MILKTLYNKLRQAYYSFFRPASVDIALIRRQRLSIAYAMTTFTIFVLVMYGRTKNLQDPLFMEKPTRISPPDKDHVKVEVSEGKIIITRLEGKDGA